MSIEKIWVENFTEVTALRVDFVNDFHMRFVIDTSSAESMSRSLMSASMRMRDCANEIESQAAKGDL